MTTLKAPHIRRGDTIALIAPASTPPNAERIDGGKRYLESRGYTVVVGTHVQDVHGYLAGTDEARLADLNGFIRRKDVRAIIAIRGGYGTPRILDGVDYAALKKDPKIIVGYSDLTGLQLAILAKTGLVTFSGPMSGVEMWKQIDPYTEDHFWRMVESPTAPGILPHGGETPATCLKAGVGTGPLIGGNASLIAGLMGSSYMPPTDGSVFALEDVDEAPHRVDRMMAQFRNAGILRSCAAMLYGQFTDCVPSDTTKPYLTVDQVLTAYAADAKGPVVGNLQFGHIPKKLTLPLGAQCRVNGADGTIEILEGCVV